MMRPKTVTLTAAGTSQAVPLDYYTNGYAIGITKTNAVKYTLQHSFTDPGSTNLNAAGGGVWINHDDTVAVNASAATVNTNYAYPPRAARIVVASAQTGASIVWTIVPLGAM